MNTERFFLSINGEPVHGRGRISVVNPADGKIFAEAPDASREQLDAAVAAARRAFSDWAAQPAAKRSAVLGPLRQASG